MIVDSDVLCSDILCILCIIKNSFAVFTAFVVPAIMFLPEKKLFICSVKHVVLNWALQIKYNCSLQ